mmetsp:Transcript_80870/g.228928  ORF Transcript_80870/g.228928 Transcript_80870/m.228928 type:complete len:255 (-) Transcript_80870:203-967(-)
MPVALRRSCSRTSSTKVISWKKKVSRVTGLSTRSTKLSPQPSNVSTAISFELLPWPVNHSFTWIMPFEPEMENVVGDLDPEISMEQSRCAATPFGNTNSQLMAESTPGTSCDSLAEELRTRGSSPARALMMATPWQPRPISAPVLEQTVFPCNEWPTGRAMSMRSRVPILPSSSISRTRLVTGCEVGCVPSSSTRPASSEARCTTRASRALRLRGVSLSTCLPARRARTDHWQRMDVGRTLYTASTSGSSSMSS